MSFRAFKLGLLIASIPLSASASSTADCSGHPILSHHWVETEHEVVGEGVVAFYEVGGFCDEELGCTYSEFLNVAACESGQTLRIVTQLIRESDDTHLDRTDEAVGVLRELADDDESYPWISLKRAFERKAFQVDETTETNENCACAAAFPELRNGKEKFEGL